MFSYSANSVRSPAENPWQKRGVVVYAVPYDREREKAFDGTIYSEKMTYLTIVLFLKWL